MTIYQLADFIVFLKFAFSNNAIVWYKGTTFPIYRHQLPNKIVYLCRRKTNTSMNRIKEVLEVRGISQTKLADRLGTSFNMVNLYATNKIQPPIPVLYQIADILNVDVRELLLPNK